MIPHHIFSVPDFTEHKQNLIDLIFNIPINSLNSGNDKISHQDYNMPEIRERKYVEYFKNKIFFKFVDSICNFYCCNGVQMTKIWFQVYKKDDCHNIHSHPKTNLTNIFYINLPNKKLTTQIFLPQNKLFKLNIKEGDIVTFPGYYAHKSPINNLNEDKIIISFNTDLIYGDEDNYNKEY
tara:strand:+ start:49 stop:588 length:540 start_codon:yes stop_codon:yes gene_type:complete